MEKDQAYGHGSAPSVDNVDVEEVLRENAAQKKDVDVAAVFLDNLDPDITADTISAQEARKVLWKIDLIILPIISLTTTLAAVDKVIISNAAIYGMTTDAHLVGNQFSWVGSIFYFGYLIFEGPAALVIQRLPVAKVYAATIMGWAILMMCTAAAHNFAGLATVRFIMGMLEAFVFPCNSIITVMWYKNTEQPLRAAFWFNQFSSIFTGIVSYGIGHTNTALHPWRLLFLVLGAFSVLWAIILYAFLPDSPVKCWWMTDRQKYISIKRVKDNNTGVEDKKIKWYQVRECLLDPKTWLLALFACAQNIPNGGLITFAAIIVSGLGYSPLITTLLGIPTGVLATAWQLILCIASPRITNSRCVFIFVSNFAPLVCAILMWKLPSSNQQGLLAAYYVFYTYWAPYVLSSSLPMSNTSGHSKKVSMNAVFFLAYCVGNIIGPQTFQASDAPSYSRGYEGLLACIVVAMVSIAAYGLLCRHENKRRDREQAASGHLEEPIDPFSDLTDKEKKSFRYTY